MKGDKIRASFTIEAAIAMGFILCFLNMSISYEIQQVHRILEKISAQRKEQENWSLEEEINNYIKFKEILGVDKESIKEESGGKNGNWVLKSYG